MIEEGGQQGNAEAASELAGEVIKSTAAIDLLGGQITQGRQAQRQEHQDRTNPAKDQRPKQGFFARIGIDPGQGKHHQGGANTASSDNAPGIELLHFFAQHEHGGTGGHGPGKHE